MQPADTGVAKVSISSLQSVGTEHHDPPFRSVRREEIPAGLTLPGPLPNVVEYVWEDPASVAPAKIVLEYDDPPEQPLWHGLLQMNPPFALSDAFPAHAFPANETSAAAPLSGNESSDVAFDAVELPDGSLIISTVDERNSVLTRPGQSNAQETCPRQFFVQETCPSQPFPQEAFPGSSHAQETLPQSDANEPGPQQSHAHQVCPQQLDAQEAGEQLVAQDAFPRQSDAQEDAPTATEAELVTQCVLNHAVRSAAQEQHVADPGSLDNTVEDSSQSALPLEQAPHASSKSLVPDPGFNEPPPPERSIPAPTSLEPASEPRHIHRSPSHTRLLPETKMAPSARERRPARDQFPSFCREPAVESYPCDPTLSHLSCGPSPMYSEASRPSEPMVGYPPCGPPLMYSDNLGQALRRCDIRRGPPLLLARLPKVVRSVPVMDYQPRTSIHPSSPMASSCRRPMPVNRSYISPQRRFLTPEPRRTPGGMVWAPHEDALLPPVPTYSAPTTPVYRAGVPMEFSSPRSSLTPVSPRSVGVDSPVAMQRCPSTSPSTSAFSSPMQQVRSIVPSQKQGCGPVFVPATADSTQVVITTTTFSDTDVPSVYGGIGEAPTVYGGPPEVQRHVPRGSSGTEGEPVVTGGSPIPSASRVSILR